LKIFSKGIDRIPLGCFKTKPYPLNERLPINTYLRHIQAALNTALERGFTEEPLKIKRVKTPKKLPRILTPAEREAILVNAMENDFEVYRIILFTLWTGCRREEVLRLKWSDVHLGEDSWCVLRGKGDKERMVPLLSGALDAVGEPKDLGAVFHQFHKDTLSHRFKWVARACGIEDVRFHNLRHSAATQMIESGIIGEVVQRILGHADYRTTQIYVNLSQATLCEEMKKLRY
jgi:integrase